MSQVTGGSSDMRSSGPSADGTFDVSVESGVLDLLRAVHHSPLASDIKNALRDDMFTLRSQKLTQVPKDVSDRFAEHGFTLTGVSEDTVSVVTLPEKQPVAPDEKVVTGNRFGGSRMRPKFGVAAATAEAPSVPKEDSVPVPVTPVTPSSPEEKAALSFAPETVTAEPAPAVEPMIEPAETPVSPVVPEAESIPPSEESAPVAPESQSGSAMDRIKQIKHEVNKMVGNPVNLIDVHNEVGREYMNALLDAMKKSAGGSQGDLSNAMQRLEASFVAVKETMGVHERSQGAREETAAKIAAEPPAPEVEVAAQAAPAPEPAVIQQEVVTSTPIASPVSAVQETAASQAAGTLTSVAKEKQVQEMMLTQKREAATTDQQRKEAEIAAMDPLMTPEVTAGLNQLLTEWSLFKQSGLFGTGPSGSEHVLYKKLAPLPMAAVVAGRFDGVTPQIKRSISDYMNGWRYEEGIVHEQGEAFETYLRRVIKHILEKRK